MRGIVTTIVLLLAVGAGLPGAAVEGADKVRVVTTIPDLKSLTEAVGGDLVDVESLMRGTQNLHEAEVRPSMMLKLRRAQLLAENGAELDAWVDVAVQGANNGEIVRGGRGRVEAGRGVPLLEVPGARVDRSMGDVHPYGNPHYLLDPLNGLRVARLIAGRLAALRPERREYFHARTTDFARRLGTALVGEPLARKYDAEKLATLAEYGKLDDFLHQQGQHHP